MSKPDQPAPRRVHALGLAPGDRFRIRSDGPAWLIVAVTPNRYMARRADDPRADLVTLASLMESPFGLLVIPEPALETES